LIVRRRRNYNPAMVPTAADTNRTHALVASLRDFVLRAKRSLDDEIRSYPTPIPRCDAQFNHAYEQRARLAALLQRIDAAAGDDDPGATALLRAMAEFSALPSIGESHEERSLRSRIADALAAAGVQTVAKAERSTADLAAGGH
jgi:hypothetical protein